MPRCPWAQHEPETAYHDAEWGVPSRDDRHLFELLTLEGAQAGLSWATILRKRAGYRRAFKQFDPAAVARLNARSVDRLVRDASIVRHRGKIESVLTNARAFLAVQQAHGSFADYLWAFVDGTPIAEPRRTIADVPAVTPLAETISKDLKHHGFRFVGPTTVYAYCQAVGLVNDHLLDCPRHAACAVDT